MDDCDICAYPHWHGDSGATSQCHLGEVWLIALDGTAVWLRMCDCDCHVS